MGSGGSKKQKPALVTKPPPPPQHQIGRAPAVPQGPPYYGPTCEYRFENFQIPYEVKTGCVFMPSMDMQISTLDAHVYIPTIASLYDLGFRLLSFAVFPGSMTASGFMSVNTKTVMKCQAVCRKVRDDERDIKYRLRVEKSVLPMQMFTYGIFKIGGQGSGNAEHIFRTIFDVTSAGARLISIEITGGNAQNVQTAASFGAMGRGMGMGNMMSMSVFGFGAGMVLGVDIFFEEPTTPGAPRYIYQCVPLTLEATVNPMSVGMGAKWNLHMDWQGLVAQYCGMGWKLIEVFLDQSSSSSANTPILTTKITVKLGALFIFEKEESKINDNTPLYEVTMVEYRAPGKATAGIGSMTTNINVNWDGAVAHMGAAGWELVRIMNTPGIEMKPMGLHTMMAPEFEIIMWMFFQRRIMREPPVQAPTQRDEKPPEPVLPPQ